MAGGNDKGHHHRKAVTPNVPQDSLHLRIWTGGPRPCIMKILAHTQPRHPSYLKIIKILLHWFHLSLLSIAHIPCLEGFQWNHPFTTSCVFLTHNSVITPDKATIPWNQQVEFEV